MASRNIGPYRRLWRDWLLKYRGLIAVGVFAMLIGAITSAGYAKGIQLVMHGFETADPSVIWWGPLVILLLTSTKAACTYIFQTRTYTALVNAETDLQKAMHEKLVHADLARLQNESSTALATRFTADIMLVRTAVIQIFGGLSSVLIIVASVAVMLTIDWLITLTLVLVFSLAVLPVNRIGVRIHKVSRSTQDDLASMTGDVSEALSGIRMARTYQLEDYLINTAKGVFDRLLALKQRLIRLEAQLSPMMEALSGAAIAALLVIVAWRLSNGDATLADFMGLMTGFGVISQPARNLGKTFAAAKQGEAALDRVFEIIDLENTIIDAAGASIMAKVKGRISFQNVAFAYPDGKAALNGINLEIPAGKTVAFVGRSGAGKSTIFNLLPRLYDVTDGAILIDGVDIRAVSQVSLRQQIAMVGQDSILLTGSVGQNIAFGRVGAAQADIVAAAKSASADGFIMALPDGYDSQITSGGATFSGGEKQRLSIARAMLRDAPILLLDEPTSALDAESEAAIRAALARLSKGRTTLIIAHRLATIMDADMIVVLDQGKIAETGTHSELLENDGIYAELYRLQFGG
ncbi:MAG: ABC transporter ATP-binding protein/permease [Rhodobacteraceae bacterium]|nr:ABC transporter ATP-binding protein/permease [Paracoccaceae bacterium]